MSVSPNQLIFAQVLVWGIAFALFILTFLFRDFILLVMLSFIGSSLVVHNFGYLTGNLPNFMTILDEIDFVDTASGAVLCRIRQGADHCSAGPGRR